MKVRPEISIDAGVCFLAALCLLMLPLQWDFAVFGAAAIHEACHILAAMWMRIPVTYIRLGFMGAQIGTGPMLSSQECICAAAGPAGSFLLLVFAHVFPELACCGTIQGLFNLLPLYPFDGGRILRSLILRLNRRLQRNIEIGVCCVTMFTVLLGFIWLIGRFSRGKMWFCGVFFLIFRCAFRNISCKDVACDVQCQ